MTETPALALCPVCLRPLYLPPGYVGASCPGHAQGLTSLPGAFSGQQSAPEGRPVSSPAPDARAQSTGRPGGAPGGERPPRPPVTALPPAKEPEGDAKAAFDEWVGRFKAGKIDLPDKAHFFRLLDALRAAGLKGKVRAVIDQVPPAILYPVLLEIGALREPGGGAAVTSTGASGEGPNGEPGVTDGSACQVEGCANPAVNWRKTAAGEPTKVCKTHTLEIDKRRKEASSPKA